MENISISPFHHYIFRVLGLLNADILDKVLNVRTSQTRSGSRNKRFFLHTFTERLERISTRRDAVVMFEMEKSIFHNSTFIEYPSLQSFAFLRVT